MFKKTIEFEDFNGEKRTGDYYFNISKSELISKQFSYAGGYSEYLKKIYAEKDQVKLYQIFEDLIKSAYGVKSEDGKRFMKSEELFREFKESGAYDELILSFFDNAQNAVDFVKNVFPKDISDKIDTKKLNLQN